MSIPLTVLDRITIATPCTVPWDEMQGDERRRFCTKCSKHVHDISNMTAAEAIGLLNEAPTTVHAHNELPCLRLYRRRDGRVVTSDCPLSLRERIGMWLNRRSTWAASLFATLFLSSCGLKTQGEPCRLNEQTLEIAPMPRERVEIAPVPHEATRTTSIPRTSPEASTEK